MSAFFVLDCSVAMAWCFQDEGSLYADQVLESFKTGKAIVPPLWHLEIANVLLQAERKKKLTEKDILHFLYLLEQLPIHTEEPTTLLTDLIHIGRRYSLTAYDSCYLHLALTRGLPLASLDTQLIKSAQGASVPLYLSTAK